MKQRIAFAMIMGIITTGIISFSLIAINVGFGANFVAIWLKSWVMSYCIVIPCILLIGPKVQSIVEAIFREKVSAEEKA